VLELVTVDDVVVVVVVEVDVVEAI